MIWELLAHKDYLRVLHSVKRKPMRFGALLRDLDLNPAQVDRAIKFLSAARLIAPALADTATGKAWIVYLPTARGGALIEAFQDFSDGVARRKAELGAGVSVDLEERRT